MINIKTYEKILNIYIIFNNKKQLLIYRLNKLSNMIPKNHSSSISTNNLILFYT
jgi:hypothetical protein